MKNIIISTVLSTSLMLMSCGGGSSTESNDCDAACQAKIDQETVKPAPKPDPTKKNTDPAPDDSGNVVINGVIHPGIMSNITQLNRLKERYNAGDTHTMTLVQDLLDYTNQDGLRIRNPGTENPETGGRELIYCGGYNKGRDGVTKVHACDWPAEDGITAYTYALLSYITQDKQYAKISLNYLESWSNPDNFKGFDTEGLNALLQHGWILPWFTNAAEILRYTYDGWEDSHTKKIDLFVNRLLPLVIADGKGAPNNWLHARIEAHIASAVWLSDSAMLNTALNRWKLATRTYFYIDTDNGSPLEAINHQFKGSLEDYWDTTNFVAGMTMETCRDLDHQGLGILSIFNSLTIAKAQGIDILTGNDNQERMLTFLEVQPVWWQSKQDNPDGICNNPVIIKGNDTTGTKLSSQTVRYPFVLGYQLLGSPQRPLTLIKEDIDNSSAVTASRWVKKWETLLASSMQ